MSSTLSELIQPLSWQEFALNYFSKAPFATPHSASKFQNFIDWEMLGEIVSSERSQSRLAKAGKMPTPAPTKLDLPQVVQYYQNGWTLFIRNAERSHPKIASIAEEFFKFFGSPIDIQLYATPAEQQGFGWHYDLEEVFVLQTTGEKEFFLYKNTDSNPREFQPSMLNQFEKRISGPEMRCNLRAGDWLYIPSGYWHKAQARSHSIHMSIGVMLPAKQRLSNP